MIQRIRDEDPGPVGLDVATDVVIREVHLEANGKVAEDPALDSTIWFWLRCALTEWEHDLFTSLVAARGPGTRKVLNYVSFIMAHPLAEKARQLHMWYYFESSYGVGRDVWCAEYNKEDERRLQLATDADAWYVILSYLFVAISYGHGGPAWIPPLVKWKSTGPLPPNAEHVIAAFHKLHDSAYKTLTFEAHKTRGMLKWLFFVTGPDTGDYNPRLCKNIGWYPDSIYSLLIPDNTLTRMRTTILMARRKRLPVYLQHMLCYWVFIADGE